MADTLAISYRNVEGAKRVIHGVLTAGGGAVGTGLKWIDGVTAAPMASQTTGGNKSIKINTNASAAGDIQMASATTGDDYQVAITGR